MSEQEPVRIPKEVLEELESVRRYARVEVLDTPTLRYLAMETEKPASVRPGPARRFSGGGLGRRRWTRKGLRMLLGTRRRAVPSRPR